MKFCPGQNRLYLCLHTLSALLMTDVNCSFGIVLLNLDPIIIKTKPAAPLAQEGEGGEGRRGKVGEKLFMEVHLLIDVGHIPFQM